jgi:hypothetical protein
MGASTGGSSFQELDIISDLEGNSRWIEEMTNRGEEVGPETA